MASSKNPSCLPSKAQGGYFQTTVNKAGDNYIDPLVGGMISHEKTTLTTWTRCRVRLVHNIFKKKKKRRAWLRLDGSSGALPQPSGFDGEAKVFPSFFNIIIFHLWLWRCGRLKPHHRSQTVSLVQLLGEATEDKHTFLLNNSKT